MIDVGKMIAKVRNDRGYSQQRLADKLNLSKQAISNYETGKREPDYVTLEAIADALNVPITMLISPEEQAQALKEIYATYPRSVGKNSVPELPRSPEWRVLSEGLGDLEKKNKAAFQATYNYLTAMYPDIFTERNDDDDTES